MNQFQTEWTWLDGKFVRSDEAKVSLLTHTLHYGLGVFEGTRAYCQPDGNPAVFRLSAHLDRLRRSSHIMQLPFDHSLEELHDATLELVVRNEHRKCYLRHLVFVGGERMGLYPGDAPNIRVSIQSWDWGAYLGEEGIKHGIRCRISSFVRPFPNAFMTKSKTVGNYANSILAKREAVGLGYDEAIMLDSHGNVAEGSGENLFMVRDGVILTPPKRSVLDGITRDSVIQLAGDLGVETQEVTITRDELYCADEVFLSGTAAEVTPVREVDDRAIGAGTAGPVTKQIQDLFFQTVAGENPNRASWLTPVRVETAATA